MRIAFPRLSPCCFLLVALILGVGCNTKGKEPENQVSGKITLSDGSAVAGTVIFVGSDNKEVTGIIKPDGTYLVLDPPQGKVKILVKGMGGIAPQQPAKDAGGAMKDAPSMGGKAPPARYASIKTTDLEYEVKSGKQTHDITLKP